MTNNTLHLTTKSAAPVVPLLLGPSEFILGYYFRLYKPFKEKRKET